MNHTAIAFMSYVRLDDQHEQGRLTQFCERLAGEVRMQTGEKFHIFQDRNDIGWGQQWKERIEGSLDSVTFLIPIITPGFFKSPACREEFERFLQREKQLGRNDLILPVYYVECAVLSNETKREQDALAQTIAARQLADWREFRFEPYTSPEVGKMLARLARQIADASDRAPAPPPATAPAARAETRESAVQPRLEAATGEAQRTPAARTEPPTRVVDALHRGDHATLSEALRAAKPGDRILVRPGLYREGVVIDKPVEIVGDGDLGDVVIEATGKDVVRFQANMGRIANLTLRQAGGGDWYGVDIAQGRLELEGCDITSLGFSCVGIHGGADPRLRRNRIHDSKHAGVVIYNNGQGTLENNDICANAFSGVAILTGGNPILRHNRVSKNGNEAVWVYQDGAGVFEDNDLRGNLRGAWDIAADCQDKVKRQRNQE